jgi:hypothetical protein
VLLRYTIVGCVVLCYAAVCYVIIISNPYMIQGARVW